MLSITSFTDEFDLTVDLRRLTTASGRRDRHSFRNTGTRTSTKIHLHKDGFTRI